MTMNHRGTTALITGASSGLGAEYATQLAARGADVVLVARREDRLKELAARIRRDHGVTATVIAVDLLRQDAATALRQELDSRGIRIQVLINNAGFGLHSDFIDADEARTAEMLQLNIATLVSLTRAFLPDLVRAGSGAVVNIASTGAFQPCPTMAVYGATKAFVLNFTEAVAYETRESGVRVLAVCPGATSTEFREVSGLHADREERGSQTPAQVVRATLRALDRGQRGSIVSGARNTVLAKLAGVLPRPVVTAVAARVLS
ncbi:SDR family oxidoreductase [Sinomonas sp. ASV322]|uniref:SDR family NAD(P)-dependent oxidoreductase n=1 Tax=Sinomonas sp. ASV322 TaxID=3041920 RepID=UPI0027DDB755|nr:SDR family oxidoreductase [Sinomonas sp. ASV322]MDQ4504635.1 SDR family oxidoreductase [Sinomonas sp. ASV322]